MDYTLIKKIAINKGLSLPKLAEKMGVSKTSIYYMFNNKTITVDNLELIAKILDVDIALFFSESFNSTQKNNEKRIKMLEMIIKIYIHLIDLLKK